MKSIFGNLFDINGDGKIDLGEEFLTFMFVEDTLKEKKKMERMYLHDDDDDEYDDGYGDDSDDDDDF